MSNVTKNERQEAPTTLVGPAKSRELRITACENGAIVQGFAEGRTYCVEETAVFNDPNELGEWMERWLRGRLGR